jgi:hypothetical protein
MRGLVEERHQRLINRLLVLIAIAALLGGLLLSHWDEVLAYTRWL